MGLISMAGYFALSSPLFTIFVVIGGAGCYVAISRLLSFLINVRGLNREELLPKPTDSGAVKMIRYLILICFFIPIPTGIFVAVKLFSIYPPASLIMLALAAQAVYFIFRVLTKAPADQ
jgi:hypothetical protein